MSKDALIEKLEALVTSPTNRWVWLEKVIEIVRKHTGWQPIETAPRDGTAILVRTAGGHYLEAYWSDGLLDKAENLCSGWFANNEDRHPACWTEGVCWESNEDEEPSDPPIEWMFLSPPHEQGESD